MDQAVSQPPLALICRHEDKALNVMGKLLQETRLADAGLALDGEHRPGPWTSSRNGEN